MGPPNTKPIKTAPKPCRFMAQGYSLRALTYSSFHYIWGCICTCYITYTYTTTYINIYMPLQATDLISFSFCFPISLPVSYKISFPNYVCIPTSSIRICHYHVAYYCYFTKRKPIGRASLNSLWDSAADICRLGSQSVFLCGLGI